MALIGWTNKNHMRFDRIGTDPHSYTDVGSSFVDSPQNTMGGNQVVAIQRHPECRGYMNFFPELLVNN